MWTPVAWIATYAAILHQASSAAKMIPAIPMFTGNLPHLTKLNSPKKLVPVALRIPSAMMVSKTWSLQFRPNNWRKLAER